MSFNRDISIFLTIEANLVNAKASTFKFMQVDVALNDDQFALAA